MVYCVKLRNVLRIMHCISLAILSRLSRFHPSAVGTNWPSCVDVPLNTKQTNKFSTTRPSTPPFPLAKCTYWLIMRLLAVPQNPIQQILDLDVSFLLFVCLLIWFLVCVLVRFYYLQQKTNFCFIHMVTRTCRLEASVGNVSQFQLNNCIYRVYISCYRVFDE